MNCLKCGKETTLGQVFCDDCREIMQQHPISPSAVVHLPKRSSTTEKLTDYEEEESAADVISQLKSIIRWLTLTVGILSILLCVLAVVLLNNLDAQPQDSNIGKNYSTIGTEQSP